LESVAAGVDGDVGAGAEGFGVAAGAVDFSVDVSGVEEHETSKSDRENTKRRMEIG
jgi:hypothetical protein